MKRLLPLFCVLLSSSCVKKNESVSLSDSQPGSSAKDEAVVPTEEAKAKVTRMVKRTALMTKEDHGYMFIETPDDAIALDLVKKAAEGTMPVGKDIQVVEFNIAQWFKDNTDGPTKFRYLEKLVTTVESTVTDEKIPLVVFTGWGSLPEAQ